MPHTPLRFLTAALTAAIIAGCGGGSSDDRVDAKTSDMWIDAFVFAENNITANVSVDLFDPAREKHVKLRDDDAFTACVGVACKPLTLDLAAGRFKANLPYVAETAYIVALSRGHEVSAPSTFVTLPTQYVILTPPAGLQVTDGQTIDLQWSPHGIEHQTTVFGSAHCEHANHAETDRGHYFLFDSEDTGTVTVDINAIMNGRPSPLPEDPRVVRCSIKLEVSAVRQGVVDSAFRGITISSRIVQFTTLDYTPSQP